VSDSAQNTEKVAADLNKAANDLTEKNKSVRNELEIFLSNLKTQ
jgi:hypothetical protein